MKVGELIEQLQKMDPEREVVLSIDPEGNGYHPANCIEAMSYDDGEVHYEELTEELEGQGYTEEDVRTDGTPAVVIWP